MKRHEEIAEKFVTSVTASELLVSAGIQMLQFAHDLAFTDAAYGQEWAYEAANRLATLSELLNILYKRLDVQTLAITIELPNGVVGQIKNNPMYDPKAEEPDTKGAGSSEREGGVSSSIDDFPF